MAAMRERRVVLEALESALAAVGGERLTRDALRADQETGPCYPIAIGKAAAAQMRGAVAALGDRLVAGLVITKQGHLDGLAADSRLIRLEAGHPLPDQRSLLAGRALLDFCATIPAGASVPFLISGGSSSLVEQLPAGLDAAFLQQLNRWLLGSGLPIDSINRVRKACSLLKGGRLLATLAPRHLDLRLLLLSDVPNDDPAAIGSGLLVAHAAPALSLAGISLPEAFARRITAPPPTPPGLVTPPLEMLATNRMARQALSEWFQARGLTVQHHDVSFEGDALSLGQRFAEQLLASPGVIQVWGGESTVTLPVEPGRGGRNQHLALAAAERLAGHTGCLLLSVGTDGSDGPTADAGALVDGATLERAASEGYDSHFSLQHANAGALLEASGDLIDTGPTGTNVMDLVIGWRHGSTGEF